MSRSYRCIIFALVGWLILSGQAPNPSAKAEQPNTQQRIADALTNIAAIYNEQSERAQRSPDSNPCEPGNDQRDSDLCAQWKAADAATDAAWWAQWAVWIGGASTILVLIALGLAFQSNWIARDTAKRQLRAYLTLGDITFQGPDHLKAPLGFQLNWQNTGQTPATQVFSRTIFVVFENSTPVDVDYRALDSADPIGPFVVGPGQSIAGHRLLMSHSDALRVVHGNCTAVAWGRMSYQDIFADMLCETEFCIEIKVEFAPELNVAFIPYGEFNRMTERKIPEGQS